MSMELKTAIDIIEGCRDEAIEAETDLEDELEAWQYLVVPLPMTDHPHPDDGSSAIQRRIIRHRDTDPKSSGSADRYPLKWIYLPRSS